MSPRKDRNSRTFSEASHDVEVHQVVIVADANADVILMKAKQKTKRLEWGPDFLSFEPARVVASEPEPSLGISIFSLEPIKPYLLSHLRLPMPYLKLSSRLVHE